MTVFDMLFNGLLVVLTMFLKSTDLSRLLQQLVTKSSLQQVVSDKLE